MKPRYCLLLLFIVIVLPLTAQIPDSLKYTILSPAEFINVYKSTKKSVLIDVRANKDYRKSRISSAINVEYPFPEDYFNRPDSISRNNSLFIYCYAGFRSRKAATAFYNQGYRNIFSLEGGFMKWKSQKMPIDKRKIKD